MELRSVTMEIQGKDYTLKELTVDGLADFENFVRSQRLKIFMAAVEGMDPEEVSAARMDILRATLRGADLDSEMNTINGGRYIIYLALRDNPGVTLASMSELITLENLGTILDAVNALSAESPNEKAVEESPGSESS